MVSSYKKYKWQPLAGDFSSPFFRNEIWTKAGILFPKMFDLPQPLLGIVSNESTISYLGEMESWTAAHEALKARVLADFEVVEKLINDTNSFGETFNAWSKGAIFDQNLESKSSDELVRLLQEFSEKQATLYAHGFPLPILDFLGFSFIERSIEAFLKKKVPESEFRNNFDIFTYPLHNSFAQDQEEALLKLMTEFYSFEWKKNVLTKNIDEIKKLYPDFYTKLQEHTANFSWVYYVYAGPAFTERHFLDFIKDYLSKEIEPQKKLMELGEKRKKQDLLREQSINKLCPEVGEEAILRLAGKIVWAKPRRKDYQSRSYYHVEKLHRELAKRLNLSLSQIRSAPIEVIEKSLKDGIVDTSLINSIYKLHVCIPDGDGVTTLSGNEASDFSKKYMVIEADKNYADINEIKGNTASPGKKTGKVKIINRSEDMDKMDEGDILVSLATTPSIVPAMKKAAAIVTDEGGLTCHAAIVSRELGITCVIGTKIATKVFNDGDVVEVDAEKGVVRLLKRG